MPPKKPLTQRKEAVDSNEVAKAAVLGCGWSWNLEALC